MDDGSCRVGPSAYGQLLHATSGIGDIVDQEYAEALAASREELNKSSLASMTATLPARIILDGNSAEDPGQVKSDWDVRMSLAFSNVFTAFSAPDADTLLYIGPPPRLPGQSRAEYQYVVQHFSTLYRMHSQTLKDLRSSAFDRLLGPRSEKTRRRFGKERLLSGVDTADIKYYIDLRPAEEGDEAVEQITDLTCTHGVLNWHKAKKKYTIPLTLICGRDDFRSPLDQCKEAEARKTNDENVMEPLLESETEYSALRHRSAIERVLQAIGHNDPKLDSAPKMWTFFQVAKQLDVAKHQRISGWIMKWLYLHPNSNFIQSNPEVVYRIGMGMMSVNMICDAYSMLAGEKALLDTSDPDLRLHLKSSVHGRPLEILDDDERNRIDHAAVSLHARIKSRFEDLVDKNMNWLKQSKLYSDMLMLKSLTEEEQQTIIATERMVKDYVRGRILWMLARDPLTDHSDFDQAMRSCYGFRDSLPEYFHEVYRTLNKTQRLLTRTFWIGLHDERLEQGDINTWTPARGPRGVLYYTVGNSSIGNKMIVSEDRESGSGVKRILFKDLAQQIANLKTVRTSCFAKDQTFNGNENTSTHGKHDLIDIDSEEDDPIYMANIPSARSGSEKRRRLSANQKILANNSFANDFSLQMRNSDLVDDETAASRAEYGDHETRQLEALLPQLNDYRVSENDQDENIRKSNAAKLAFDLDARLEAERTYATSWESYDGEIYMLADPSYLEKQSAQISDMENRWFAIPRPFKRADTATAKPKTSTTQGVQENAHHVSPFKMQYFDAKHSIQPQSPVQRYTPSRGSLPDTEQIAYSHASTRLYKMLSQLSDILGKYCEDILYPPHIYHGADVIPQNLMDTLMCLNDDEWKYLPLWAGGCDDGTGGVFNEADVPNLEAGGFAGGKRGLDSDAVDGKSESDRWSEVGSEAISTVGKASKLATDGTETVKSFDSASTNAFMRQDELWEQIRDMKHREDEAVQKQVGAQDEDQITIMSAASDIQGDLFGDIDDDRQPEAIDEDEDQHDGFELVDDDADAFEPVPRY